ncbi:hypothetical protein [Nocardia huaxiensis]|uniref:DUF4304 domain-containing protein n=1 Tax=Nocardia huaxiensis TaxID=2755382 RepID=A0A7D6ZM56_9NOCA|nr:hypothetical protein [Nocardia huaxiensis]QLY33927.1 hypothetical protein H0264_18350 [Nocardia huaxiensis]UFS99136.1 hypothetical protein LPY97_15165 [Nocardia huaxiensis]
MVKPESALRRLMRDTGKLLQPYGFEGDEPTWVRVEDDGVAAVGRTRVQRTWTGGAQVMRFGLTLNATPVAWWEFCNWRAARHGAAPVELAAATGPGLLTEAGLPEAMTTLWSMSPDAAGHVSQAEIDTIRAELPRRVHAYARRALRLLEPGCYLEELVALPDPRFATWEAIVVLLAGDGPGARLEDACEQLRRCCAEPDRAYVEDVIGYAQHRTALV